MREPVILQPDLFYFCDNRRKRSKKERLNLEKIRWHCSKVGCRHLKSRPKFKRPKQQKVIQVENRGDRGSRGNRINRVDRRGIRRSG